VRRHVPAPVESVAGHMYRMAIMCQMVDGVKLQRASIPTSSLIVASSMKRHGRRPSLWH
jgi:hypothetical protein